MLTINAEMYRLTLWEGFTLTSRGILAPRSTPLALSVIQPRLAVVPGRPPELATGNK